MVGPVHIPTAAIPQQASPVTGVAPVKHEKQQTRGAVQASAKTDKPSKDPKKKKKNQKGKHLLDISV
jgi:hypothetical protein